MMKLIDFFFVSFEGDSLKQCDSNNRNALNTCLFKIVEDLRPFMPTGKTYFCKVNFQPIFASLSLRVGFNKEIAYTVSPLCFPSGERE